ncbi:MAG TPA: peptidoglycan-associated lipoprotein Pal [Candidatus Acidoferrales bacterium]
MQIRSFGKSRLLFVALGLALLFGGCAKQPPPAPPPAPAPAPAPPPARPTVTLQASPTFIQAGEASTLTWSSTNATSLTISPAIGQVAPEGSQRVNPSESVTYTIAARGPGGTAEQSVRITVGAQAAPAPPPRPTATMEELFAKNVFHAYFDYDRADIRADAREALSRTAEFLRSYRDLRIVIEGHCDERGSTEYNLGLGERRAQAARQFLINLGIAPERIQTVSWGKERPFCTQSDEQCWQSNRRAHFVMGR